MQYLIIGLAALFFSLVDVRLFGLLVNNYLFLLLFSAVFFYSKMKLDVEFLKFNLPFIFLLAFGIIAYFAVLPTYSGEDLYYILFKNKDLLAEVLLALMIYLFAIKRELGTDVIRVFIEVYFLLNFIYIILVAISPDLVFFFHEGEKNIPELLYGRERLLGWEPSYTVPVSILFAAIYSTIYKKRSHLYIILGFTLYIIIAGGSKTAFIFLFVSLFIWLYFMFSKRLKNKNFFLMIIAVVFLVSASLALNYLNSKNHYTNYKNLDIYHQYKIISFITRKELIQATLEEIIANPMGYGYGNATVCLANSVEKNIDEFVSPEIKESEKFSKSAKSQFLDYTLSGGIIFLFLFFRQQKFLLNKINELKDQKVIELYKVILVFAIGTIIVGERIPFLLILNFLWVIMLFLPKKDEQVEKDGDTITQPISIEKK